MASTRACDPLLAGRARPGRPLGQVSLRLLEQQTGAGHPGRARSSGFPSSLTCWSILHLAVQSSRIGLGSNGQRFDPELGHPVDRDRRPAAASSEAWAKASFRPGASPLVSASFARIQSRRIGGAFLSPRTLRCRRIFGTFGVRVLQCLGSQHVMGIEVVRLDVQELLGPVNRHRGQVLAHRVPEELLPRSFERLVKLGRARRDVRSHSLRSAVFFSAERASTSRDTARRTPRGSRRSWRRAGALACSRSRHSRSGRPLGPPRASFRMP